MADEYSITYERTSLLKHPERSFSRPTGDFTQYKKAPTFAVGCECWDRQPSEKERLYESRKVYRHGRSSGHHLGCRDGCWWQVDHGMPAGDQGVHDRRVHPRTARDSVSDLGGRNLRCLVTRSPETPGQPASSLRSAKSGSVERGQQE